MTDKENIEAIRAEALKYRDKRDKGLVDGSYFDFDALVKFIDSMLQGIARKQSVEEVMAEVEEKSKAFTEAHKGETAEQILAEMRGEEPVSEDLYEAAEDYAATGEILPNGKEMISFDALKAFKAGAKWQKKQFENNRLKHCNSITNEQAELEQGFIDQHFNKYQRMPTFLDAIEYGMKKQREQMMKDAVDGEVTYGKSLAIPSLGYFFDKNGLDFGDKVKLIIIKEDKGL